MFILILQQLFIEAALDLLYFPVWWYTRGAQHAARWCLALFQSGNRTLAPGLWLKNIFVPMFGQYDLQGKIISFFMRFVNVIGRSIMLGAWLTLCILLFVFWLAFPPLIIAGFVFAFVKLGS